MAGLPWLFLRLTADGPFRTRLCSYAGVGPLNRAARARESGRTLKKRRGARPAPSRRASRGTARGTPNTSAPATCAGTPTAGSLDPQRGRSLPATRGDARTPATAPSVPGTRAGRGSRRTPPAQGRCAGAPDPRSAPAKGSSAATASAARCESWSQLSGTWNASWPPGRTARVEKSEQGGMVGAQWSAALEKTRSNACAEANAPMSPRSKRIRALPHEPPPSRASRRTNRRRESPRAPVARASSPVSAPGPHPRSTARPPGIGATRSSRSKNGFARSAPKRA